MSYRCFELRVMLATGAVSIVFQKREISQWVISDHSISIFIPDSRSSGCGADMEHKCEVVDLDGEIDGYSSHPRGNI